MAAHTIPAEDFAASAYVTEEEYLRSSYRPDCDYIDGRVEERNVGEYEHSGVQTRIGTIFENHRFDWGVKVKTDCRLQVSPNNYRVPDVTVLRIDHPVKRIVREAPLVCIEVLGPEDTWARLRERLNEYLAMGVANVWCFDPATREVRTYTTNGFNRVTATELAVEGTAIRLDLAAVFAVLDED